MGISATDFALKKANDFKRSSFFSNSGDSRSQSNPEGVPPPNNRNLSSDDAMSDDYQTSKVNDGKGGNILTAQE